MTKFKDQILQYAASFSVSIFTLTVGYQVAWSSPILEKLVDNEESPIGVSFTSDQGAWMTSVLLLGNLGGSFLLGPLQDLCGRKGTLLISTVPNLIGWIMIYFGNSFIILMIARFILGLSSSAPTMTSGVYISEISEPEIRGKLGMFNLLMVEVGMVLVTAIGSYSTYGAAALIGALIPIVFTIFFIWMPESPYYYLRKGDVDNAIISLKKLRRNAYTEKEVNEMKCNVEKEMNEKSKLIDLFTTAKYRKAFIIVMGAKTIQQFSGTVAMNSYTKNILNQVQNGLDPRLASVLATGIALPSVLVGSYVIDRMGRKPLYCIATAGCAASLLLEFIYFYMQDELHKDVTNLGAMPFAGIFLFNIFRSIGIQTLPYILISEVFPTNMKAWGIMITLVYSSLMGFLVALFYPLIMDAWGVHYCFLIFMIFCILGLLFIIFVITETKGKTLHGIQDKIEAELTNK